MLALAASAGVALSHSNENAHTLLARAEAALSRAEQVGGGRHILSGSQRSHDSVSARPRPAEAPQDWIAYLLLMKESAVAANEADILQEAAEVVMRQIWAHLGLRHRPSRGYARRGPKDAVNIGMARRGHQSLWRVPEASGQLSPVPGTGLPGCVPATGRPAWVADLEGDTNWCHREHGLAAGLRSGFAFPVLVGQEVVAVAGVMGDGAVDGPRHVFGADVPPVGTSPWSREEL